VRQIFYLAVTAALIGKTEQEYKNTIVRLLGLMRKTGELPYGWLADNTRWMRKPQTHGSLEEALRETAAFYRRNIWRQQPAYVEIWLEKDALSGVLSEVTYQWDVPLMVTRGYSSLTFLAEAAEAIRAQGKPTYIYYFGDWDPSGADIPRCVERTLRELSGGADITFTRQAVNPEQITRFALPTRPTKDSDSRKKTFAGESVEVDALPPEQLRQMVQACIVQHVDTQQLRVTEVAEASERELLRTLDVQTLAAERARRWGGHLE
jgi:hypothetical protein